MTLRTLTLLAALALPPAAEARTLTVRDAVRLALEHDRGVAAAEAGEDKARIEARAALLGLGPALSLTGSYTYLGTIPYIDMSQFYGDGSSSTCSDIDPSTLPTGWTVEMATQFCELLMSWMAPSGGDSGRIEMGLHDNYAVTAEVQQVLFAGGALFQARRAAADLHDASEEQVRAARQQAAWAAEQAFWGVLLARGAADVTSEAASTVEAYVRDLENLVSVGIASRSDLLAAQARLSQARLDAMRAAHGQALAEAMFKVSLGIPDAEPLDLVAEGTPFAQDLPRERDALLDMALRRRPDLGALDENLSAMDHYRKAAWGQWLPSLALVGQVGWRNPDYSLEPVWYETASITLAAQWSFWDRGAALHRARAAAAALRQVQVQRELAVDMLGIEIRNAVSGWDEAAAEVEVARAGLAQAEESHRLQQERFRAGVVANTELLAAQAALSGARLSLLQAETRVRMSRAALTRAVGIDPEVSP